MTDLIFVPWQQLCGKKKDNQGAVQWFGQKTTVINTVTIFYHIFEAAWARGLGESFDNVTAPIINLCVKPRGYSLDTQYNH